MKKYFGVFKIVGFSFFGAFLAFWTFMHYFFKPHENSLVEMTNSNPMGYQLTNFQMPSNPPVNFVEAADNSVNSVVHIQTITKKTGRVTYDPFQDFFFGNPYQKLPDQQITGSGSGVIINPEGYIVTNNHVINNATEIEVTLNDKRTFKADLVGTDPSTDLAVIKIKAEDLVAIKYGDSDFLKVGEWVVAVGNPFNLTSTVTAGIVSAKGRNINILKEEYAIESFIQTDAAVNPGNSGGALVNTNGELVGINTAIASNTGSYTGYSFAVPVNLVKKVVTDLVQFGMVQRGLLGVKIGNITQEKAKELGLKDLKGVLVADVIKNGAADDAGLKSNDVITKVGLIQVSSTSELQEQVSRFRPGDAVNITLIRDGKEMSKKVVLKNTEGTTAIVDKDDWVLGAKLEWLQDKELKELNIKQGVKVAKLQTGVLLREGIKEGFVITQINHKLVQSLEQVNSFLSKHKGGILIEGVYPNGSRAYYGFGL